MNVQRMIIAMACALALVSCVSTPPDAEPTPAPTDTATPAPVAQPEPDIAALIAQGDAAGLQALFKGREQANTPDADNLYPLHAATLRKSSEMVEILLAMGADPDPADQDGKTPLRYAVDQADEASARALVRKGGSIFMKDKAGV
ncbi:MAG: ankyrin repeat domain-containing protein, partial [Spirochaetales bacterium]|nr:ankyrin repeat domain-containing protein [Spirochaetales bacterium]